MSSTKPFILTLIILLSGLSPMYAQDSAAYLTKATELYEAGKEEKAKELFRKAAGLGSAEAHFKLTYNYHLPRKERVYHLSQAARLGHTEAFEDALSELLYTARSLTKTDPMAALQLYEEVKTHHPDIELRDEKEQLKLLKISAETSDFNTKDFIEKYSIQVNEDHGYDIWELAEEASRDGRFGKANPELVLDLVVRGGFTYYEFKSAVNEVYENYQKGVAEEFNICDHISSGAGMSYCAGRANEADERLRREALKQIATQLNEKSVTLLYEAYQKAVDFIDIKTLREEYHAGSGRGAWISFARINQKNEFIDTVKAVINGYTPSPKYSYEKADQILNATYQRSLRITENNATPSFYTKSEDLRAVQRIWIPYRDQSVYFFLSIRPDINKDIWLSWLTEMRIAELNDIPGMSNPNKD